MTPTEALLQSGTIQFLHGKIRTSVHLYQKDWASRIIFTGKFSAKVTDIPTLFALEELQQAAAQGRISGKRYRQRRKNVGHVSSSPTHARPGYTDGSTSREHPR